MQGGPTSHIYYSQRLRLHYVDWGNPDAPPMLLIHGGRDHCRNWDWVAEHFQDQYHIIAPDLRGHGDSAWMIGGNYTQLDYAYDIAQLLHQTELTPATVVGHSLGGSIALTYAGLYPQNVTRLAVIEGLGPPPAMRQAWLGTPPEQRITNWIDDLRKVSGRVPRRYATIQQAFERMHTENPHLTDAQAHHLTVHGSNQNEDGTWSWKFDNYVRTLSPQRLPEEDMNTLLRRISCPVQLFRGTESWAADPAKDGRMDLFQDAVLVNVEGAGHWLHHDQLDVFTSHLRQFLSS